ncbi:MAG: heat-shock protein [Zetaproteobacteria bacterium]|nr:heat-shock protein [Zetaproteobacteria bacterium]
MTDILLTIISALLLVLLTLFWQQRQNGEGKEREPEEDNRVSPLLRGINYLLSDAPDKAIQEMVQVARLRTEAIDVYMSLGEMFRSQGEIGRAVRIHQNILARPNVSELNRLEATMALAKDFQTGGLLDRALRFYEKSLELKPNHKPALEACLRIREQSGEWQEAENLLQQLEQLSQTPQYLHRAYLFAELAKKALKEEQYALASSHVEMALQLDQTCASAYIINIRILLQQQSFEQICISLEEMWRHSPEHVALAITILIPNPQFIEGPFAQTMQQLWKQYHRHESTALAWIEGIHQLHGATASRALLQALHYTPQSLRASLRLAVLHGDERDPLTQFAKNWRKSMKQYYCSECGVEVIDLRWQCPQCHTWGTMHMMKDDLS